MRSRSERAWQHAEAVLRDVQPTPPASEPRRCERCHADGYPECQCEPQTGEPAPDKGEWTPREAREALYNAIASCGEREGERRIEEALRDAYRAGLEAAAKICEEYASQREPDRQPGNSYDWQIQGVRSASIHIRAAAKGTVK
jgi:hypothetical protein